MQGGHCTRLQTHLRVVGFGRSDFVWGVVVYNPFNKVQVGSSDCDLSLPTTGHKVDQ